MKYPITPDYLAHVPDPLAGLYLDLEDFIIRKICESLSANNEPNATALELIRQLQRRGMPLKEINNRIKKTLRISDKELSKALNNAVQRNNAYYNAAYDELSIVQEKTQVDEMAAEVDAIMRQTQQVMRNITQSMGFGMRGMDGSIVISDVQRTYQKILDRAELKILSSGCSYNEAIRDGVREMASSGLVGEWVEYQDEEGEVYHRNRVDVAVRRAVMTGVTQISGKYTEAAAEQMETPYFEVTAHRGARDKDGPNGWENHKKWQGKVYSIRTGDIYPSIYEVCGLGDVTGLEGVNCRHRRFPFVEGFSERAYTDEQLKNIDRPPFNYQGRKYSAYEATQQQRKIETALRQTKRRMNAFKAAGDQEAYRAEASKYHALNDEYKAFSEAAGLPLQRERSFIRDFGPKDAKEAEKALKSAAGSSSSAQMADVERHTPVADNDVLQEYLDNAKPGSGTVTIDTGLDTAQYKDEVSMANWLHRTFGGDIRCIKAIDNVDFQKNPDYRWRGKFWDLKCITTETAAKSATRKAKHQIAENPGGVILNLKNNPYDMAKLVECVDSRLKEHKGQTIDVLIISNRTPMAVLRYGK